MNLEENNEINTELKNNNTNLFNLSNKTNPFIKKVEKYYKIKQQQILKKSSDDDSNIKNEVSDNIDCEIYFALLID